MQLCVRRWRAGGGPDSLFELVSMETERCQRFLRTSCCDKILHLYTFANSPGEEEAHLLLVVYNSRRRRR